MGDVLGGSQSPGGWIWGFTKRRRSLRGKFCLRRKSCRRGKLECEEELAGAEEVSCAGAIAGTMAIASVGVGI